VVPAWMKGPQPQPASGNKPDATKTEPASEPTATQSPAASGDAVIE